MTPRTASVSSPNPQSARHAAPVRGVGIGAWTTILVITLFTVAMIVWAGINASQFPTATIQQRQALEAVQTPDAIFAKALDRAQPVAHILANDGRGWRDYDVEREGVLRLVGARVERGAPRLWRWLWTRAERYFS